MLQDLNNINTSDVSVAGEYFFALPSSPEASAAVLFSVPWDVTVSYGKGCSDAPEALLMASAQLDLFDAFTKDAWRKGIATLPINDEIKQRSAKARAIAEEVINHLEAGGDPAEVASKIAEVNKSSQWLNNHVYESTKQWIEQGKIVGLIGGDHSTPLGYIKALGEKHDNFGILHIDAHRDLRCAYEGFESSHASIMYNVLQTVPQVERLVQVSVRDFCQEEQDLADNDPRVISFDDKTLAHNSFNGKNWDTQSKEIISVLPQKVYISFDIDGLDLAFAPHTGTPVPGGMSYQQAVYLLEEIINSGREIIGFDLVEVVPVEHSVVDVSVGARMLFKLSTLSIMK